MRHHEHAAVWMDFGDVAQAGHEARRGLDGILSVRQMIGDRIEAERGKGGRKPLAHFPRRESFTFAEVQLPQPGIDLQSQARQIGARSRGAHRPAQR